MKRAILILFALMMVLSLAACGGTSEPEPTPEEKSEPTPEPQEDLISIEWLSLTPFTEDSTGVKFKIRNLSNKTVDSISITLMALDENGDIIYTINPATDELEAGQAVTAETALNCKYEDIASFKIKDYVFLNGLLYGGDVEFAEYELSEAITLVFSEETDSDYPLSITGHSYLWLPIS